MEPGNWDPLKGARRLPRVDLSVSGRDKFSTSIAAVENLLFSKEQLELHYKLMGKTEVTSQSSCAFTQSGISEHVLCLTIALKNVPWIIDSRASDHRTQESKVFSSYTPYSGKQKVLVTDDSHIVVHGKENIMINENIT